MTRRDKYLGEGWIGPPEVYLGRVGGFLYM